MAALTLTNGRVIDPSTGLDETTDVVVSERQVERIGKVSRPDGPVFDASGAIVCPGLIDPHVHFREPGQEEKETIATGAAAAVRGGFATVCCMPNTRPALDDDARIEFVYRQAARADQCHVFPVGAVTKGRQGQGLAEIGLMARAGAVGFSDDGVSVASADVCQRALRYIAMTGRPLMEHCEEASMTAGASMNAGEMAVRLGLGGSPPVAEELIIQRDVLLNRGVGCRCHVQHLSTAGGVAIVRAARAEGQPVTAEATPHHLHLTDASCGGYDARYKVNPPLRSGPDVEAVRAGVADGAITVLATDHAPHTREEKDLEFAFAPHGVIDLECALPLYAKALVETEILDWPGLLAMMTQHPARLCGLSRKGSLRPGSDPDVTVVDPTETWTIDAASFASRSGACPFDGWEVTGRPIAAVVSGRLRMNRTADRLRNA